MGSIFISDFKFGQDRRRKRVAGTPGTLWTGENVVITRGGDIERAKRFVSKYTLPAGQTFGLVELRGQIWVFGSATAPAVPVGVNYQQLIAPSGANMSAILDARAANGKLYVIASYVDGNTFHFYDGVRITQWDTVAAGGFTYNILADYFADLINANDDVIAATLQNTVILTAKTAGTPFTVSKATVNNGVVGDQDITLTTVQANVPAVARVQGSTVLTILSGTSGSLLSLEIDGAELIHSSVAINLSSGLPAALAAIAQGINNNSSVSNYTAAVVGSTVVITAPPSTGAVVNGFPVLVTSNGNLVFSAPAMSGGVDPVAGVAQVVTAKIIGTPEAVDLFILTINGVQYKVVGAAASTGNTAFVSTRRIFSTAGSLVVWCALAGLSPAAWSVATTYNLADTVLGSDSNIYSSLIDSNTGHDPTTDAVRWRNLGSSTLPPQMIWVPYADPANAPISAGNLNVSNDAEGSERLIGIGVYLLNQMAAFTRRNIRIYNLDTDATQIGLVQPVDNTGALAARSILAFGSTDTFYLADSGIRSLRPRQTTNTAYADDIGTAIDPFVRDQINSIPSAKYGAAVAVMQPRDDRFWLAVDDRIYVLSYFPTSQISAWSYISPGFSVSAFARVFDKLYARSGDTLYLYGGDTGEEYPIAGELIASVELPFAAETPPGRGMLTGFDMAAVGEWQVDVLVDPNNENAKLNAGICDQVTYGEEDISIPGRATHFAIDLTCSAAGYASLSNITLHTDAKETEI